MSRLDSVIRRLQAQKLCLNYASKILSGRLVKNIVMFEIGLGNGRTYDHLLNLFPGYEIYAFDKQIQAHPNCIPDVDHRIVGDIRDTLPRAVARFKGQCVLAHIDIGSGDSDYNCMIAEFLGSCLKPVLAKDALIISDQPLNISECVSLKLPPGVQDGRYHMQHFTP
ncbi:class I SAM-dependent methyltransferase [Motiliproteus sp. MSK22-1]|uniref:class I SAM-dependent methyltransferase n=1 Tax=Motiliproteus sp. MSK22-1 TaxID=1897630 RepID=UPI0009777F6D|nr:class I SAM-dependent methyltransferase [Motiliproteus sp. MSK22-1]OMH31793.1 hypothetical protein BGP75_16905 [Motiliproteus sp. MSK22-1]